MTFARTLLAAAFSLGALATGASAATFNDVSGIVCEGGVTPAPGVCNPSDPASGLIIGDFNSDVANPTLNVTGDTHIFGGVAHRTTTTFQDNWTMNFGSAVYSGTFSFQTTSTLPDGSPNFDGSLFVNGTEFKFSTPPADQSFSIGNVTGSVIFVLDPILGDFSSNPDEVATWDLELSQVPLPASALLLIAGLGGLGALRRAKRTA